jgi:hypothetical protein
LNPLVAVDVADSLYVRLILSRDTKIDQTESFRAARKNVMGEG